MEEDNVDQVMLPAKHFDWSTGRTGSGPGLAAEVLVTSTDTTRVQIDCEGPQFLDRIRDCVNRDESVVRALKELGSEAALHSEEWEECDGLVLFRGRVYVPLDRQL